MNFGKCVFASCKKDSTACYSDNGKPLLVCRVHYEVLSELHDEALIEKALGLRSESVSSEGGEHVRVHNTGV